MPRRLLPLATAALTAALALSACSTGADSEWTPTAVPQAQGKLGATFWAKGTPPAPESTISPSPGSWDSISPKDGYRVALIVDGVASDHSTQTEVLRAAVNAWADEVHVQVDELVAATATQYLPQIEAAVESKPDLVISVGNGLTDPVALVSASHLGTQFLLVGSEIAEPTANVTAADWVGAMYRGEGLGLPEAYDPASFTAERADRAVRAGVAAVLGGLSGLVVQVS